MLALLVENAEITIKKQLNTDSVYNIENNRKVELASWNFAVDLLLHGIFTSTANQRLFCRLFDQRDCVTIYGEIETNRRE